ncbi:MAG: RHS repeat-associated core domain-containing protein [Chloroflexi bacterium]|nr:RHS repeat-associated core domain-containing protein [Chloroflexota bacterium]
MKKYLFKMEDEQIEIHASSLNYMTMYYPLGSQLVAMRVGDSHHLSPTDTTSTVYYLGTDQLGSTAVISDIGANKVGELRYRAALPERSGGSKPWGESRYSEGSLPTTRRYTGQIEESALGLYFYNARFYDPTLGRFITPDTIFPNPQNAISWDRYAYTHDNPIRYNDPTRHDVGCSAANPACWVSNGLVPEGRSQPQVSKFTISRPTTTPGPRLIPGSTPTPTQHPLPTLSPEQVENAGKVVNGILDIGEGMNLIHAPSFVGASIDASSQYFKDKDKGYNYYQLTARSWTVAGEGQLISGVSLAVSGLGTTVTLESGPGAIAVGVGIYTVLNVAGSKFFDQVNEGLIFQFYDNLDF